MKPKALFLDFDGTLVDTLHLLFTFYLHFLEAHGCQGSREEFEALNGYSAPEVMQALKQRHGLAHSVEELLGSHRQTLLALYVDEAKPFPGTIAFLKRMRALGVRLAVVSSAGRELLEAWLHSRKMVDWFDALVTPEGLAHSKPDPAIYKRALAVTQLAPEEALVVEDAPHGLAAGVAAGIPTVAFVRDGAYSFEMPPGVLGSVRSWGQLESVYLAEVGCFPPK